jgi:hypothetical protein
MDIENELALLESVNDQFKVLKDSIDKIQQRIADKPAMVQIGFIQPLTRMVYEMFVDLNNPNDSFLNQESNPTTI